MEEEGITILNAITIPDLSGQNRDPINKFAQLAICLLSGLILEANVAYAQEPGMKTLPNSEAATTQAMGKDAYEKLLKRAEGLIKSGNAAEAYALLEPLEFEHSGEERFDYLIGIAALDSGKPDKATLAFERILMLNPLSAPARMEMGRAYYQLGDIPRAKTEFETVSRLNTSAPVQSIVQKYLDDIALHESGKSTQLSAYIEGMVGSDSNVNNSVNQPKIFVDAMMLNVNLEPTSVKTGDQYHGLAAGGKVTHKINTKFGLYAGIDVRQRRYLKQNNFDALGFDAQAGMTFSVNAEHLQLSVLSGQYNLGGARYSDAIGAKGEWRHAFSPSNQLNVFAQQTKYRFADTVMQANDYVQQVSGAGWTHALADGKSTISASFYFGAEQDISTLITTSTPNGGRIDGASNFNGIRINGQTAITDKTTAFLGIGEQRGTYNKTNPLFLRQRTDRLNDLTIGADWRPDKLWTIRTQLVYSRNDSNIEIYAYDKTDVSLAVRRNFR
jgi:tetratricopeptide (TPR) repeat protein